VEVILCAAVIRGLSQVLAATGRQIGELGSQEMDEGMLRMVASDAAAQRADKLMTVGVGDALETRGAVEAVVAQSAEQAARDLSVEGARGIHAT
jgi:hypothetical protein